MIKNLNINEVDILKVKLKEFVKIKLLQKNQEITKSFFQGTLNLEEAIKIYIRITAITTIDNPNKSINDVMENYLTAFNIITEEDVSVLNSTTFDYRKCSSDEHDDRCNDMVDMDQIEYELEDLLSKVCEKFGVYVTSEALSEIILYHPYQVFLPIYNENANIREDILADMDEGEEEENSCSKFYDYVGGDAIVIAFENLKISSDDIDVLNLKLSRNSYYSTIRTEFFVRGEVTYFVISDTQLVDCIDKEIVLMLIGMLITYGGK